MRPLVLVLACVVLSGCGGDHATVVVDTPPRDELADRIVVLDDDERGFSVAYPGTWQRAAVPLTPYLGDPVEILALGTYELRPGGDRCAHQPVNAVADLGPDDALIVIFERAPPYAADGYPPRAGLPQLDRGTGRFCVPGTQRSDAWFSFGESGRAFYALLAFGESASAETRAQLQEIYESIAFDER